MSKNICLFAYRLLSNSICAFREGHSAEHALFRLTELFRKALADGRIVVMVLMDLSKAYNCIPHDILITKLAACGFGHYNLLLNHSYLSNRKQRVKVSSEFSEWLEIKSGAPQESVLGPLFFKIFINDLLLDVRESEICYFADDTTMHTNGNNIGSVILSLEEDLSNTMNYIRVHHMAANRDKFKVMFLGIREQPKFTPEISDITIPLMDKVKLLGVTINPKLKFDDHIKALGKGQFKLHASRCVEVHRDAAHCAICFSFSSRCLIVLVTMASQQLDMLLALALQTQIIALIVLRKQRKGDGFRF